MKTIVLLSAAILVAGILNAQNSDNEIKGDIKTLKKEEHADKITLHKLEGKEVSYQAKQQFYTDFGNLPNVVWHRYEYFDVADFVLNGKKTAAYYDPDASLTGTVTEASFADISPEAQKQIHKDYKDYHVQKVIFFDDNEANSSDMILYGSQFADEDNYFVELSNGKEQIVLQVTIPGEIYFFKKLS